MSGPSSNIQAVFLVDLSTFRCRESKGEESVSLCIFRILNFLSSQRLVDHVKSTKIKPLKWGYKLFDIDEKTGRVDATASGFQEFKLKNFQQFEQILKKILENEVTHPQVSTGTSKCQQDAVSKPSKKSSSHPAQCLSKRLTDTLYDFQWDIPDITSPVKGRRRHGSRQESDCSNYVFLISRVPCDKQSLRHYCNKVVMDRNVFLESFMPAALRKQFHSQRKIQLHWIDTGRYQVDNVSTEMAPDQKSYDIVKQSLKCVGGALVPIQSLVTHLSAIPGDHLPSANDEVGGDSSTLAVTRGSENERRDALGALLSSFACMSACSTLMPCWSSSHRRITAGIVKEEAALAVLVISRHDGCSEDIRIEVAVKLVPIIQIHSKGPQEVCEDQQLTLTGSDGGCATCCLLKQTGAAPHKPRPQAVTRLEMRGCMEQVDVRQLGASLGRRHFLCLAAGNLSAEQQQSFTCLLQTIHSRQLALILSVTVDGEPCPYLALLEASSRFSAHLSYLSLALTLQVEKLITLEGAAEGAEGQVRMLSEVQGRAAKMVASQIAALKDDEARAEQRRMGEGDKLWTGVLNPWHTPGSVLSLQSALNKLTDRVEEMPYLSEGEKAALRDLRQVYHQENQPPFLQNPSHHSTPLLSSSSSTITSSSFSLPAFQTASTEHSLMSWEDGGGTDSRSSWLTRGQLMVMKAQSSVSATLAYDEVDGEYTIPPDQEDSMAMLSDGATSLSDTSVTANAASAVKQGAVAKTEEDLKELVQQLYSSELEAGTGVESTAQSMAFVVLNFMTAQDRASPQKSAAEFLKNTILKSDKELKASYGHTPSEESNKARIVEMKLQVLLRLEMESVCVNVDQSGQEQSADEIVGLLRSLTFVADAGEVPKFLKTSVLTSYLSTLPNLLVTIYDELMQPLPASLARFTSPATVSSVGPASASLGSHLADSQDSSSSILPSSNQSAGSPLKRTRSSLRHHPSFTGISNKRQIVVHADVIKKSQKTKSKKPSRSKARRESKSPRKQLKVAAKKAKRNLFNTEPCTSLKDSQKTRTPKKKHAHSASAKPSKEANKTFVAETPRHHQRFRSSWQQAKKSDPGPSDVQVIAESPLKDFVDVKCTPGRYKAPRRVLRQAFYSTGREQQSRNLTRALEKPGNVSGQHHLAHLRSSKGGRLSEALMDKDKGEKLLSPRRQVAALLMQSPSPGQSSPAHFTRSKTPEWSKRKQLFQDTRSMPALFSAAKILDFTSPKKRLDVAESPLRATRQTGLLAAATPVKDEENVGQATPVKERAKRTTPSKGKAGATPTKSRVGSTALPAEYLDDNAASAWPSAHGNIRQTTPTKAGRPASQVTPIKRLKQTASPKSKGSVTGCSQGKGPTPKGGTTSASKRAMSTPRSGKGRLGVGRVSPTQSSSSSSSQQSSILDYVSPSRRQPASRQQQGLTIEERLTDESRRGSLQRASQGQDKIQGQDTSFGAPSSSAVFSRRHRLDSSLFEPGSVGVLGEEARSDQSGAVNRSPSSKIRSSRRSLQNDLLRVSGQGDTQGSVSNSSARNTACMSESVQEASSSHRVSSPSTSRQLLLSPVRTSPMSSSKSLPFVPGQLFMSPTKTHTKPILKNSPMRLGDRAHGSFSRTPQKSPRVTFDINMRRKDARTPSPEGSARTPESMSKWPRRKRRQSSDASKSPVLSPLLHEEGPSTTSDNCGTAVTDPCTSLESRIHVKETTGRVTKTQKRGLLLACPDAVSSPSKRRRKGGRTSANISRPELFSEDAMDSYFSASNSNVFLGACSVGQMPSPPSDQVGKEIPHKKQRSPRFKSSMQSRSSSQTFEGSRGFDFASSSKCGFDSIGGSQGFDVASGTPQQPQSPTFNTSPSQKRQTRFGTLLEFHSQEESCSQGDRLLQHTNRPRTPRKSTTPGPLSGSLPQCVQSEGDRSPACSSLTPLRVKGMVTDRKYSPRVSTSSLTQLMSSPILLSGPKAAQGDGKSDDIITSTEKKTARKRAKMADLDA